MPIRDREKRAAAGKEWDSKRHAAITRLRIALQVLEEYGCLWEYERACADAGIEHPLLIPPTPRKIV